MDLTPIDATSPSSLFSGLHSKHKNLIPGKNIVCDAELLPLPAGSLDVSFARSWHITSLTANRFLEINRVLKHEEAFVLMEPSSPKRSNR
jgi:ubiquinone/menaquinone biosynthesis C-methylase UbiE